MPNFTVPIFADDHHLGMYGPYNNGPGATDTAVHNGFGVLAVGNPEVWVQNFNDEDEASFVTVQGFFAGDTSAVYGVFQSGSFNYYATRVGAGGTAPRPPVRLRARPWTAVESANWVRRTLLSNYSVLGSRVAGTQSGPRSIAINAYSAHSHWGLLLHTQGHETGASDGGEYYGSQNHVDPIARPYLSITTDGSGGGPPPPPAPTRRAPRSFTWL